MDFYQFLILGVIVFLFAILAIGATKTKNDDLLLNRFFGFLLKLKGKK